MKLPPLHVVEETVPLNGDGEDDAYSSPATLVTSDDETHPGTARLLTARGASASDEIKDDQSCRQFRTTASPKTVPDEMALASEAPAPRPTCAKPSVPRVLTAMGSFDRGSFEASDFVLKVFALNRQGRQLVNSFSLVHRNKRFQCTPIFELPAGEQLRSRSDDKSHVLSLDMTAEGLDEEIEARLLEIGRPLPCEVS